VVARATKNRGNGFNACLKSQDDAGQIDYGTVIITVTEPAVPSIHPIALYTLLPSLLVEAGLLGLRPKSSG
jgi:hypothetical protein